MMVQPKLGEGSAMPTNPHHTPTILQSSSSQPQKTHKPRKPTRKVTQVPQPSDPIEHVVDKVVHKELDDSLVRAATTAFSLEAKQDSEKTKTTQSNEIASLKRRFKKLEKRNRSRTHKLKRLYKVSLTARVESSDDEKHLGGEEVFVAGQEVVKDVNANVVEEVVNAPQDSTSTTTITTEEITLAQSIKALKTSKPKGKRIMIEEPVKPKKKDQIMLDEEATKRLQAKFDKEERLARERAQKEQEANIALIET
nr:hypothetical protein [Tanacetum cinerariifolium]